RSEPGVSSRRVEQLQEPGLHLRGRVGRGGRLGFGLRLRFGRRGGRPRRRATGLRGRGAARSTRVTPRSGSLVVLARGVLGERRLGRRARRGGRSRGRGRTV